MVRAWCRTPTQYLLVTGVSERRILLWCEPGVAQRADNFRSEAISSAILPKCGCCIALWTDSGHWYGHSNRNLATLRLWGRTPAPMPPSTVSASIDHSMPITALNLSHITYTYPGAPEPIFEDVTVTFAPGWTAVLGDNGIGKSTLMHIARGALTPERGQVSPSDAVIAFCPQDVAVEPANLDDFAGDWSPETIAIRDTLGIADDWPYRYDTLSGGERKRLQIACALALQPDVLILDEPTNHVDVPTRDTIARAMLDFTGQAGGADSPASVPAALPTPRRGRVGIVVSHDIELIDQVAMRCACFERRHIGHNNVTQVHRASLQLHGRIRRRANPAGGRAAGARSGEQGSRETATRKRITPA